MLYASFDYYLISSSHLARRFNASERVHYIQGIAPTIALASAFNSAWQHRVYTTSSINRVYMQPDGNLIDTCAGPTILICQEALEEGSISSHSAVCVWKYVAAAVFHHGRLVWIAQRE